MTAPVQPLPPISDLGALLPEVADSARSLQAAAAAAGVKLTPYETRRSQERQNALYAQGRTAPGDTVTWTLHSNHTPGAAVDFIANDDPTGRDPGYQWLQDNAPQHGFNVLGPKDPGHVEMPSAVARDGSHAQSASDSTDPLDALKALKTQQNQRTRDVDPLEALKTLKSAQLPARTLPDSFSAQSTAVAPDQAARRTDQAKRPLLESVDLPFGLQHDVNQAAQGATFGFSDEIAGGLRALLGEKYSDAVANERAGLAQFQKDHGLRSLVDQIAGGVASTGGINVAAPAKTVLGRVAQSAGVGAAAGAATGVGSAEGGIENRAKGGVNGALLGALFGGTVGAGAEGVAKIAARGPETIEQVADRKLLGALQKDNLTPDQAVQAAQSFSDNKPAVVMDLAGKNTTRLGRAVRTQPSKGSAQLDDALNARAQGTEERTINDVLSTTGLGARENPFQKADDLIAAQKANAAPLYAKAYEAPPVTHPAIDDALKIPEFQQAYERGQRIAKLEGVTLPDLGENAVATAKPVAVRDANGRLRADLSNVPGEELDKEWQRLSELNTREESLHGAVRDAGYREDYEALPRTEKLGHKGKEDLPDADGAVDPEVLAADNKVISDYNRSKIVRDARAKAMQRIEDEFNRRPAPGDATDFAFGANANEAALPVEAEKKPSLAIPTQGIDYMKRGMDDLIESKMNSGAMGRTEARALRSKLRGVLNATDEVNPDYQAARQQFAGDARSQEAYDLGRQLFKTHPDETSIAVQQMGPGEQELFRKGAVEALGDRIENRASGRNPSGIADKTLDKKRLRMMFPDDASFQAFQQRLGEETKMHQTKTIIQGGSQTVDKAAELADMADVPVDAVMDAMTGHPMKAMSRLAKARLAREVAARLQGINEAKADALAKRMVAGTDSRQSLIDMLKAARASGEAGDAQAGARSSAVVRRAQRVGIGAGDAGGLSQSNSQQPPPPALPPGSQSPLIRSLFGQP